MGGERPRQGAAVERLQDRASRPRRSRVRRASARTSVIVRGAHARRAAGSPRWRSGRAHGGGSGSRRPRGRGTRRAAAAGSSTSSRQWSIASESSPPRRVAIAVPSTPMMSPMSRSTRSLERLRAEHVLAGVQLDLAAAVAEVEEGGLAVPAAADDAPGDAVARVGLDPRRQALVGGADLGDVLAFAEPVRERVDAGLANPLELLAGDPRRTSESSCSGFPSGSLMRARAYRRLRQTRSW